MNWKVFFVGCCAGVVLVMAGFLIVSMRTGDDRAPHPPRPLAGVRTGEPQRTTTREPAIERTKGAISLSEIVAAMNKATGTKFVLHYEDGPFAVIEVNPTMWASLSPLEQKAVGTNFATLFGSTGGINCRVKVYGVEVGHVSVSRLGGWQYEPR